MKEISSRDNKIFKLAKQLQSRKYRDRYAKYLIEGPNLVRDALRAGAEIEAILVEQDYFNSARDFDISELEGTNLVSLEPSLFRELSETEHSQGIIAIVLRKDYEAADFFENASNGGNIVVLDRLQDPGNIGTIIRTADAAGYKGVVVLKGCGDIYSSKVIRAATGSVFRMPVLFADTPEQAARQLQTHGKRLFATCFDTSKWYYDVDLKENVALVIGNEGNGICEEFLSLADERIKIPMHGEIDSLNAAIAASILMYEAMRP